MVLYTEVLLYQSTFEIRRNYKASNSHAQFEANPSLGLGYYILGATSTPCNASWHCLLWPLETHPLVLIGVLRTSSVSLCLGFLALWYPILDRYVTTGRDWPFHPDSLTSVQEGKRRIVGIAASHGPHSPGSAHSLCAACRGTLFRDEQYTENAGPKTGAIRHEINQQEDKGHSSDVP